MRDMRRQRWGAHRSGQAVRASRPPFPTLARRAGSLRACRRLGFWLPRGLSYRTARSARHGAAAGRTVLCRAREARVEGGHKYHPAAHLLAPHRVHPSSHSLVSSPLQANHPVALCTPQPSHSLTMFSRVAAFSLLTLALSAAATPVRRQSCNTGEVQCCNSTHEVCVSRSCLEPANMPSTYSRASLRSRLSLA